MVVSPAVQYNRQRSRWVYTSTQSREDQFGNRNQDASYSLVTDAENFLTVCHNNVVNVVGVSPLCEVVFDAILVEDIQETTFRSPEKSGEVLDSVPFRRRVDDAEHFFQMILNQLHDTNVAQP